jgi:hypothetical protein
MIEKLPAINKRKDFVRTKSQQKQEVHELKKEQRGTRTNERKVIEF